MAFSKPHDVTRRHGLVDRARGREPGIQGAPTPAGSSRLSNQSTSQVTVRCLGQVLRTVAPCAARPAKSCARTQQEAKTTGVPAAVDLNNHGGGRGVASFYAHATFRGRWACKRCDARPYFTVITHGNGSIDSALLSKPGKSCSQYCGHALLQ